MGSISGRGLAFGKVGRSRKSRRQGQSWGVSQGRGKFPVLLALCWGPREAMLGGRWLWAGPWTRLEASLIRTILPVGETAPGLRGAPCSKGAE